VAGGEAGGALAVRSGQAGAGEVVEAVAVVVDVTGHGSCPLTDVATHLSQDLVHDLGDLALTVRSARPGRRADVAAHRTDVHIALAATTSNSHGRMLRGHARIVARLEAPDEGQRSL
jgi:hypothetical protein